MTSQHVPLFSFNSWMSGRTREKQPLILSEREDGRLWEEIDRLQHTFLLLLESQFFVFYEAILKRKKR